MTLSDRAATPPRSVNSFRFQRLAETLIIMVGALEALWSRHETGRAHAAEDRTVPVAERRAALDSQQRIIELIADGDGLGVHDLVAGHLWAVQSYPSSPRPGMVDPVIIRDRIA